MYDPTSGQAPQTNNDAVILGLFLGLTGPTEEGRAEVIRLTEDIAARMTPEAVERCKTVALRYAEVAWGEVG